MKADEIKLGDWMRILFGEVPPAFFLEVVIRTVIIFFLLILSMRLFGRRMAAQINQQLGGNQPNLVLHFDCAARGKVMFRDKEKLQLLRQFRQAVGPEAPWAGFYTFGEIGPVGKHNCYHNYTAVVLALS